MLPIPRRTLLVSLAAALPAPLRAADPWAKPPSQWTDKDIQRILTDSPWSRAVSITMSGGMPMGGGRGGRGGRGGGGMGGAMAPSITFYVRWQSAKPIKLATVRARMGAEADTSPQAREFVEREEPDYVIALIGPPMEPPAEGREFPQARPGSSTPPGEPDKAAKGGAGERRGGDPSQMLEAVKQNTWLAWKEQEKLHPSSVAFAPGGQRNVLIFRFPKDHPIELEDKEVEFCTRRGPMEIRKKFRLKDMVYEGKLCL